MIEGYSYFRKLPYSNVKMKADEMHLRQFKLIRNDRKKIKNAKPKLHEGARVLARESVYTQKPLNTDAFKHRRLYTQTLLHTDTSTHRPFYTKTLLHTDSFYTHTLSRQLVTRSCPAINLVTSDDCGHQAWRDHLALWCNAYLGQANPM